MSKFYDVKYVSNHSLLICINDAADTQIQLLNSKHCGEACVYYETCAIYSLSSIAVCTLSRYVSIA